MASAKPTDCNGAPVQVGTRVRVLSIRPSVLARLSGPERRRVESIQGEVLAVDDIDEYGSAWVKKWWNERGGRSTCHSLALSADEMEVVADGGNDAA